MRARSAAEPDMSRAGIGARLVLFSGPPGVGKSTLSYALARHTGWPVLAKDQIDRTLERLDLAHLPRTTGYDVMLDLAELQLRNGASAILDAVFPRQGFRSRASEIAARNGCRMCAVVCACSDRALWQGRVEGRPEMVAGWTPADWVEAQRVEASFEPWTDAHLLLDASQPLDQNVCALLRYVGAAP